MAIPWEKHRVWLHKVGKACDGYTLVDPYTTSDVFLMDMRGNYVHRWITPGMPRNHGVLLPNGNLLYAVAGPLPPASDMTYPQIGAWSVCKELVELDWDGNVVWRYADRCQTHTFWRMENGNTMIPRVTKIPEDLAPKLKGGIPGTEDRGMMWTDGLQEVTPDGKVVWEWDLANYLDPEVHITCPLNFRADFTHINSCEVLPDGNVLINFRNIDTTMIVDKATGNIKWQWGPGEVSHQHTPTWLDNGHILLFDNGVHRKNNSLTHYSRAVEVNPATNQIVWQYKGDPPQSFYGSMISGCQRLPNGNTLICEGTKGRVFEVTMDGEIVWEYTNPFYAPHGDPKTFVGWRHSNTLFRCYRYMPDYPGLKGRNLSPDNLPWVNRLYGPEAFAD